MSAQERMLVCMRTTLNLSDALAAEAKSRAASEGVTFTSYIEDALREHLRRHPPTADRTPLPTFGQPGTRAFLIDIEDRDALWATLDGAA